MRILHSKLGKRIVNVHYAALILDPHGKHSPAFDNNKKKESKQFINDILSKLENTDQ